MSTFTWRPSALADAVATSEAIDSDVVKSHKVLEPGRCQNLNLALINNLRKEYKETLKSFEILPVDYLPPQKYTNLGIFALYDIHASIEIPVKGFLAEFQENEGLPEDATVSVFLRKGEELMLGPLSFVNHSCFPNCLYVSSQNNVITLKTLRPITKGEEITVKYGPKYFGEYNIDCLCPHVQFHGQGTLVLCSRTRSEAKTLGEKGTVQIESSVVTKRKCNTFRKRLSNHLTSLEEQNQSLMRVSGRYATSRGKKFRQATSSNTFICRNSSDSDQLSSDEIELPIGELSDNDFRESEEPTSFSSAAFNPIPNARCSTPLHLSSFLEFTISQGTNSQETDFENIFDSSSDEELLLFENSDITVEQLQKILCDFAVRHRLADSAVRELYKLLKLVLPKPNNVPSDLCHRRSVNVADGFEIVSLRDQMIRIIERNEDVLSGEKTITIFLNTDGATPFRSSKKVFWPFWVLIDNMPSIRRTALHNMMLLALWKGSTKPDFSNVGPLLRQELRDISLGVYSTRLSKHQR